MTLKRMRGAAAGAPASGAAAARRVRAAAPAAARVDFRKRRRGEACDIAPFIDRLGLLRRDELVANRIGLDPDVLVLVEESPVVHHQRKRSLLARRGILVMQDLDPFAAVLALDLAAGAPELAGRRAREDLAAVPLLD